MNDESPAEQWFEEMAQFVVHLGFRPRDYWKLTVLEREAILRELERTNRKAGR